MSHTRMHKPRSVFIVENNGATIIKLFTERDGAQRFLDIRGNPEGLRVVEYIEVQTETHAPADKETT